MEVFCDAILFENPSDRMGVVTVLPDGSSRPAVFTGRINPDARVGDIHKITVTFEQSAGMPARPCDGYASAIAPSGVRGKEAVVPAAVRGVELVRDPRGPVADREDHRGLDPGVIAGACRRPLETRPSRRLTGPRRTDLRGETSGFARSLL